MLSRFKCGAVCAAALGIFTPAAVSAQINFAKNGYYLSLGDSVSAGEGALPVTHGFVYQLYDRGMFGRTQEMDFANIAMRGATAAEVLAFQVPQALCIQPPRIANAPTVITLTAGANDFFVAFANGLPPAQIPAAANLIAATVETVIRALIFGQAGLPEYCATGGIPGITVLNRALAGGPGSVSSRSTSSTKMIVSGKQSTSGSAAWSPVAFRLPAPRASILALRHE